MGQSKLKSTQIKQMGQKPKEEDYYSYVGRDLRKFFLIVLILIPVLIIVFFLDRRYSFLDKIVKQLTPFFIKRR